MRARILPVLVPVLAIAAAVALGIALHPVVEAERRPHLECVDGAAFATSRVAETMVRMPEWDTRCPAAK